MIESKDSGWETKRFAIGKFPDSKRILGVGPRKESRKEFTVKVIPIENNEQQRFFFVAEIPVDNKDIKGKVIFERNEKGELFKSERELFDYLGKKFSITTNRVVGSPAISTST